MLFALWEVISFLYKQVKGTGYDLANTNFKKGVVYKTHGLACELPENANVKIVFVFGSASDAVISVALQKDKMGDGWVKQHLKNLRADGEFKEILHKDVLRIKEQVLGWGGEVCVDRLMVKYDALWASSEAIADFLGIPILLPERRPRRNNENISMFIPEQARKAYEKLDGMINDLPGCIILRKGEILQLSNFYKW